MRVISGEFGKKRRGWEASGKVALFGLLKWDWKVFNCHCAQRERTESLLPIIEEQVTPDSIVYTGMFKVYNALDVTGFTTCESIIPSSIPDRQNHINGIENFGNQAKRHLRQFNGIKFNNFHWFLKDSRSANGATMEATIKASTNGLNTGIPSQSTNP